jgi:hypothetical protein
MALPTLNPVASRAGKASFRPAPGGSGGMAGAPARERPAALGGLDAVRGVFWDAYRHLFPPHSQAAQTPNGSLVISWSILDEPEASHPYAAPVMLRFEEALVETMWRAQPAQRVRLAQRHEPTLREGLRGYDPFARFPNARVVTIG